MAGIDKTYISSWNQYEELYNFFQSCGEVTDDFGNKFNPIDYLWEFEKDNFLSRLDELAKREKERYDSGGYKEILKEGYITQGGYDNFNPYDHIDIPIMNTPIVFDVWMIRNCQHIGWLQEDLKRKYGNGYSKASFEESGDETLYSQILNHTSPYDTYKRGGLGKNISVNKDSFPIISLFGIRKFWLWVEVLKSNSNSDGYWWYDIERDYWYCDKELHLAGGSISSTATIWGKKKFSPKALFRKFQKWNLPEGTKLRVSVCMRDKQRKRWCIGFNITIKKRK
jgi:hypothetical protein